MRYFPVLFVLTGACHDPESDRAPMATSAVTSISASASEQPADHRSAKPHDDDAESPLSGIGEGGGIRSSGDGDDPRKPTGAVIRAGAIRVTGRLPPEVIRRIVRQNFKKLGRCYQPVLVKDATLSAGTSTSFTIDASGAVKGAKTAGEITDKPTLLCIERAFSAFYFPQPEGGVVRVVFPVTFAPPEYKFMVGDKHSIQVTEADVVKALEAAGYKVTGAGNASQQSGGVSRFNAEKGYLTFSITLDREAKLPLDVYTKLSKQGATLEDGAWCLFVESDDKTASQELIDAIHKKLEPK